MTLRTKSFGMEHHRARLPVLIWLLGKNTLKFQVIIS
jgi:hypothetical protein